MKEVATYEIRVKGHLDSSWAEWFMATDIRHDDNGETLIRCLVQDQAALHSIFTKMKDLNLNLVAVTPIYNQVGIE